MIVYTMKYKAYISYSPDFLAFDQSPLFDKPESALRSIKARNSGSWMDCCIWVVSVHEDGESYTEFQEWSDEHDNRNN